MEELELIEPMDVPTEWCSGLTIAPKPNGAIRVCVDLTALNKGLCRAVYPLLKVNEMMPQVGTGVMFSKLDANSGLWQVRLDPKSRLLTTFVSP